jgi:glycosyltransferase involved in cell wall biosynthesis
MGLALDRRGIRKAAHLICVSEATKRDLVRYLGIPGEKMTVIYNGVDHNVFKPCNEQNTSCFRSPYLLYVGSERPRKNLKVLLRAFSLIKKQGRPFDSLKLLKVGPAGRSDDFRKATLDEARRLGLESEIHFVERMSDQELAVAYSNAVALVFPSLYEGFGLPIVEAMACGCPVITSNVSSLPEIAGSAALLVDPNDGAALAEAMRRVILDQDLRGRLRAQGLLRAIDFSWDRTAEATFAVYKRILPAAEDRS